MDHRTQNTTPFTYLEQHTTDVACSTNVVYTSAYTIASFKYVEPHHSVHHSTPHLGKGMAIFA